MRKTMLLLLFLFLFPAAPGAQAAIPDLDGTSAFRSLSATVDKISKDPKRYEKGSGREWAVKNLGSGLERVKKLIWERRGYRIAADLKSEGWSRAFLESRSRDDYQTDLDGLGPARRLVEEAASELVALRARVCRASWRRVKPGKSKKSRARAKRINRKRKAAALARQKRCRNEKQAAVQSKEERLTNLNNGIEAFRQAYINAYLDSTAAAEKEMRALEARNRASSNTLTRNELVRAVSLTNRARAAIGMPALPLPAPEMTPADTARSEFYGMMDPGNLNYRRAAASGVGVVRQGIWFEKKNGFPQWGELDKRFRDAARNGIRKIAVVCPQTDSPVEIKSAVVRYGGEGSFWRSQPELPQYPVRVWEVCNEPNIGLNNKSGSPDPAGYAADLVEAAKAIREADPQAIVLLGGLANVRSAGRNISDSDFLKAVYRFPEVRGAFDGVSLHPYEKTPEGVVRAVAEIRQILVDNGDGGKSLWITEFGWATAGPPDRLLVSRELQAVNLTRTMDAFKFLRASFNIRAACWYFWRDTEKPIGHAKTPRWDSYAGLFDKAGKPKPSWNAWLSVTGGRDSG